MFTLSALAIAYTAMFATLPATPAIVEEPAQVEVVPQCATMGEIFQCDEERAMAHPSAELWEENFNLVYVTTRLDGVEPVVEGNMVALQDRGFTNMYHVYRFVYAPVMHV